jgi:cellulose synthase/poly-beta-1,6-N-acetylglucosamine synthase-like glycosyltransferase
MTSVLPSQRRRDLALFIAVGAGVAVVGHAALHALVALGMEAWLANVVQTAVTLELNYALNRLITWRRHVAGSTVSGWQRWRRFHVARGAGLALNLLAFPLLAPRLGITAAYWVLFAVCGALNYVTDRHWSFAGRHTPRRTSLVVRAALVVLLFTLAAWHSADFVILLVSVAMLAVTVTTLVFQLYKWWRPEHNDPERYGRPDAPRLPGAILVPMRHEEAVAGHTLERLATLDHPDYRVIPIVDYADDPGTAEIAEEAARRFPDRVIVCPYPEDTEIHNKPIALNAGIRLMEERRLAADWVGVADAEDLFHPDLLRTVDFRFRATGAGIVQCGVQLMNFSSRPEAQPLPAGPAARLRRWWRANTTAWWRAANVLEYFKWFQSRLKLQAALGVMPLGGNTVFFRWHVLDELRRRQGTCWDETCLTEDCKIGIMASANGHVVDVVYLPELVTHEETPSTLMALMRQRVRWMQGFIQVFRSGEWRSLPTRGQRLIAMYVLGFQFFQALSIALAPVAVALALFYKSSTVVALVATLPLGLSALSVVLDVSLLRLFGRTFHEKPRLRDYVGVALGAYPYQVVLSLAAAWAAARAVVGRDNWVKTEHVGAHLAATPAPVDPLKVAAR